MAIEVDLGLFLSLVLVLEWRLCLEVVVVNRIVHPKENYQLQWL
jgi:hypothetical protein